MINPDINVRVDVLEERFARLELELNKLIAERNKDLGLVAPPELGKLWYLASRYGYVTLESYETGIGTAGYIASVIATGKQYTGNGTDSPEGALRLLIELAQKRDLPKIRGM